MTPDHIPDIILERYRLNELPPGDADVITDRLSRDAGLRERLAALERSDDALRDQIERLARRAPPRPAFDRRRAIAWAIPSVVVVAIVVIAVVAVTDAPIRRPPDDRIKGTGENGGPALALYRRTPDGSERLADGAVARAGDLIRVGYRAAGRRYGAIVSIDGRGSVTVHLPSAGDRAAALENDATVLLDHAYELDDAPQWERFYFIAGQSAFAVAPIVQAIREAAAQTGRRPTGLALPRGLDASSFTLQKESRR